MSFETNSSTHNEFGSLYIKTFSIALTKRRKTCTTMIRLFCVFAFLVALPADVHAACPAGWTKHGDDCFKKFPPATWDAATVACEDKNATVAQVENQTENYFIKNEFGANNWLGISRCHEADTCLLDFSPAMWSNWAAGQPDKQPNPSGLENKNFAVMMLADGKWADQPKSEKRSYVCKKPEDPCKDNFCNPAGSRCEDGKCKCKLGFSGDFCYIEPCDLGPCENGGTCKVVKADYQCTCVNHYSGKNCEVPPPCDKNPCVNGTCENINALEYKCKCNPGWGGKNCDAKLPCEDKKPCVNGVCENINTFEYKCKCNPGWTGKHCDKKPCENNDCPAYKKCQNKGNTYVCVCEKGWKGQKCEKKANSAGDPHYLTFDKKRYDFMGKCEYIYAKDCGADHAFEVLQQNEACGSGRVSCAKAVRILVQSIEVVMQRRRIVYVDGRRVSLPWTKPGSTTTIRRWRNGGILDVPDLLFTVSWNGYSSLHVKINQRYKGKMCGLLGNADGNPNNDFQLPDKTVTTNIAQFGNSWKKNPRCVNGFVPPDPCLKLSPSVYNNIKAKCGKMKQPPFRQCNSRITPDVRYIPNCEYDLCAMHAINPTAAWCQALEVYDEACTARGVNVDWEGKPGFEECGNPCATLPCSNGAVCQNINRKEFKCVCAQGFTGPTCGNVACKQGYISRGSFCYKRLSRRPWQVARCPSGHEFVYSKDQDENQFIYDTFVKTSRRSVWMNARVCGTKKLCQNDFGTVFYDNFEGTHPTTGCVQMAFGRNGKWRAGNCKAAFKYICRYGLH